MVAENSPSLVLDDIRPIAFAPGATEWRVALAEGTGAPPALMPTIIDVLDAPTVDETALSARLLRLSRCPGMPIRPILSMRRVHYLLVSHVSRAPFPHIGQGGLAKGADLRAKASAESLNRRVR